MKVRSGPEYEEAIELCVKANQPLLARGGHGVGKSEGFARAARRLNWSLTTFTLSLLSDPAELAGLPFIENGTMHHAPPAALPTAADAPGILLLEELGRESRLVRQPALMLLSARCLNAYKLPPGIVPCATMNHGADFEVADLDPALLSRFVVLDIDAPSVADWIVWAQHEGIHEAIVSYAEATPNLFSGEKSNPRGWAYASNIVKEHEASGAREKAALLHALGGLVGDRHAHAFVNVYAASDRPLQPGEVFDAYQDRGRDRVAHWMHEGRLDLIRSTMVRVLRFVASASARAALSAERIANLNSFLADLPADLAEYATDFIEERATWLTPALAEPGA